ncbi:hypothetical protein TSUD_325120 [Trifolium subterraneum]|uniref:Uncharacterized protein n=1 Tax=Trifolium subterraneum TaxID=3900 RepID=A0A2Z6N916_TRISU|nr:hypothetical protein TSUD_325120 [Trifolium subterraneum]
MCSSNKTAHQSDTIWIKSCSCKHRFSWKGADICVEGYNEFEYTSERVVCVVRDNGGEQAACVAHIEKEQVAVIVISDVPSEQNAYGDVDALVNYNDEEQDVTVHITKLSKRILNMSLVLPQVVYDDIEKTKQVWAAL